MKRYIISSDYKDDIISWCSIQNMVFRTDYTWFPFYTTLDGKDAFRLDIFDDTDAIMFVLRWRDMIDR
jgi:hypothetical protein